MSILSRLFGKKADSTPEYDEATENAWYDEKSAFMESILGKEHDHVMHAIIPYNVGGALDLYYFPGGIPGTGIATKELVTSDREGPDNEIYDAFELVMFTRHPLDLDVATDPSTGFGKAHASINSILNCMARYSEQATLNPRETCEFPEGMDGVGGKCLILDGYSPEGSRPLGLMLLMEVFREEMGFARENGGAALIELLRENNAYPYSDLDRRPVVGAEA